MEEKLEQVLLEKLGEELDLEIGQKRTVLEAIAENERALQEKELSGIWEEIKDTIKELEVYKDLHTFYIVGGNGMSQGYCIVDSQTNYIDFIRTV